MMNVMDARKVNLTIEVANAVMAYRAFMDAGAGAYSNEKVLRQEDRHTMIPMNGAHARCA
jgi:hypothetical protein